MVTAIPAVAEDTRPPSPLHPGVLYRACDPAAVPFATTDEMVEPLAPLGHDRAHEALALILGAYLSARYAADRPFALSASLVFGQSYGPVEGDSASLAELVALLSSLADVPVRQDLAVTGSVDQHGRVQPVGGLNEKIEGGRVS